jgi:two-component system OmpR family sensor kinase
MASIRTRLTAWNGGVLALVLLAFAIAAYTFLRSATLAQIDRALDQQVRIVALTVKAHQGSGRDDAATLADVVHDLETRGISVTQRSELPRTIVTSPVRIERDEEDHSSRPTNEAGMDWGDLASTLRAPRNDDEAFFVRGQRGGSRAVSEQLKIGSLPITLVATQPMHATVELLETAQDAALIALPLVLLLALMSGYLLARRALDPISAMTAEAGAIGARNLHERLSVRNPGDELGRLATTFNSVLERVDVALEQQRRFTADASHELRTPVALIRAEADVALSDGSAHDPEYREALGVVRDGAVQLSRIVEDLFLLARADAGQPLLTRRLVDLDEMVTTTVHSLRAVAELRGVELMVKVQGEAPFFGDEELLRRALRNLIDNAIKYSQEGGHVHVALTQDDTTYRTTVTDEGAGIPVSDQPHIFERFYRGDSARGHNESANGSGAGLGLAIAREIAEVHGGQLELRRSSPQGSSFALSLPIVPMDDPNA